MGLGEHILDLAAALNIPVRHIVLPHGLFPAIFKAALGHLTLTDSLHDVERHLGLQPLAEQVEHDAVTAANDLCNGAGSVPDQLIGVARPDVCAVRQARDLDQLGEVLGPGLHQHSADKVSAHLRDTERTGLAVDLLRRHAQRLRAGQQAVDLGVVHGDGVHRDARIFLKIFVERGHIVAQLVQLEQRVVQILKFKVGGQQAARHVVCRVLDGTEIVNFVGVRHNDHAAGVLARGALDARAAQREAVFLGVVHGLSPLFQILADIAVSGFILDTGNGARLEHIGLAEQLFRVAVDIGLVFAREVQVDIGLFVAVEAQERLKRDIMAVHQHPGTAVGAVLVRQVKAIVHAAVGDELTVLALGAAVMGRKAVDLRNAGEVGHSRGADGTTAAHLIAACVGVGHQLDRDNVQHRVAVAADGVQLLLEPLFHDLRQRVTVILLGPLPSGVAQLLLRTLDAGRIGAPRDGPDGIVDAGRHLAGVGDHDLVGFLFGQIVELLEHVLRGAVEQRRLVVSVFKAVARLQH